MTEPVARQWRFYLDDRIVFAEKVLSQVGGALRPFSICGYFEFVNGARCAPYPTRRYRCIL